MRIGLLECGHVGRRYRSIAGDYVDMFRAMVERADPTAEVVPYDARRGELPARPDACDAWLCTGSTASVYDDEPWIHGLAQLVREVHHASVPFVGICFGHQLIAHALGGRTAKADGGWGVGAIPTTVVSDQPWMTPTVMAPTLLYSHQDQVTELPADGRVLAMAPHCPVAMLSVGDDTIGIQAHPEFGAPYVRALLVDRVDRIGEATTELALRSLDGPTDEADVARWIVGMFQARVGEG